MDIIKELQHFRWDVLCFQILRNLVLPLIRPRFGRSLCLEISSSQLGICKLQCLTIRQSAFPTQIDFVLQIR